MVFFSIVLKVLVKNFHSEKINAVRKNIMLVRLEIFFGLTSIWKKIALSGFLFTPGIQEKSVKTQRIKRKK